MRGLSDEAFREVFGTEEQCRAALVRLRWSGGFVCPCCGHCVLAGRGLYQCNRCKKQTSPTAGTIFHATKLPLTLWFAAIHLIVTAKKGISSVELGRRLGVKQPTAWTVKHKIMAVMARREGETRLTGRVEMDDAYLGGVRSGGKRGRGAAGKTPFVAAVSTSPEGRPRKLKLTPVKDVLALDLGDPLAADRRVDVERHRPSVFRQGPGFAANRGVVLQEPFAEIGHEWLGCVLGVRVAQVDALLGQGEEFQRRRPGFIGREGTVPADGVPAQLAGHAGLEHIGLAPRFSDAVAEAGEFAVPIDGIGGVGLEGVDGALSEFGDTACHGSNVVDVWRGSYPSGKRLANNLNRTPGHSRHPMTS